MKQYLTMVIAPDEVVLRLEMSSDVEITGYKESVIEHTKFSPMLGFHTSLYT